MPFGGLNFALVYVELFCYTLIIKNQNKYNATQPQKFTEPEDERNGW